MIAPPLQTPRQRALERHVPMSHHGHQEQIDARQRELRARMDEAEQVLRSAGMGEAADMLNPAATAEPWQVAAVGDEADPAADVQASITVETTLEIDGETVWAGTVGPLHPEDDVAEWLRRIGKPTAGESNPGPQPQPLHAFNPTAAPAAPQPGIQGMTMSGTCICGARLIFDMMSVAPASPPARAAYQVDTYTKHHCPECGQALSVSLSAEVLAERED